MYLVFKLISGVNGTVAKDTYLVVTAVVGDGVIVSRRHAEVIESQVDVLSVSGVDDEWAAESVIVEWIKGGWTEHVERRH